MEIEEIFPNLTAAGFRRTSPKTEAYNCIAWAAGDQSRWWDPAAGYYWPSGVERDDTLVSLIRVYESLGYEACDDGEPEVGFDKVVLYGSPEIYEHAARQLEHGAWTSKIGNLEDIEHQSAEGVAGAEYGSVQLFMKRAKK
jgi:hypothetical protein